MNQFQECSDNFDPGITETPLPCALIPSICTIQSVFIEEVLWADMTREILKREFSWQLSFDEVYWDLPLYFKKTFAKQPTSTQLSSKS